MKNHTNSYLLKRLLNVYVKQHYFRLFIAIICMFLMAGSNALQVQLVEPLLNDVFNDKSFDYLVIITIGLFGLGVLRGLSIYVQNIFVQRTNIFISKDIQNDIYKSIVKSDVYYLENEGTSKHMTRFTVDLGNVGGLIEGFLFFGVRETLSAIFMLAVMFYNSPIMTIAAFVILPLFFLPIIILGRRLERLYLQQFEQVGLMSSTIDDTLKGIREVKSYNIQGFVMNWVGGYFHKIASIQYKAERTSALARPIMELSVSTMLALGLFWGGYMVINGDLTVGQLMAFYIGLIGVQRPIKAMAEINMVLKSGTASLKRIYDIIDRKPKIKDIKNAKDLKVKKGNIKIEKVNFSYIKNTPVLKNITMDIASGSSVALVGESGSGKSSLINLLNRFIDMESGKIKIDGIDIKNVTQKSLHKNIAIVGQTPALFNTTIRENLLFGNLEATDEELINALKQASAWNFVKKSKNKLDTLVGERGLQLSGGQRQRIAIARAFLKDAPILILDEATSALDTKSESKILTTLEKLKKGRTTITIAHRISTIMNADKIFVLQDGEIVETGTHKSLKDKRGIYAELSKNIK